MKKLLLVLTVLCGVGQVQAETMAETMAEAATPGIAMLRASAPKAQPQIAYSNWVFIQSDKAVQIRYGLVKSEGTTSFFQVQFRVNQEDEIYCTDPDCDGYVLAFSYPSADGNTNIYSHYIFPNSFTGIYTKSELMPLEMSFPDGSKRYFDKEDGFSYTTPDSDEQRSTQIIYCCVDNRLKSNPTANRCSGPGAYRNIFDPSNAITVQ